MRFSARDSLARQFEKLGLSYFSLHPTIRTVMERAVIVTGDVQQEVSKFIRVARMADRPDLSMKISGTPWRRHTSGTDARTGYIRS